MAEVVKSGGEREARRRRITERGADRLAFITGHIKSLPSDPPAADFALPEDAISTSSVPYNESGSSVSQSNVVHEILSKNECSDSPLPEKESLEISSSTQNSEQRHKTSITSDEPYSSIAAASENKASDSPHAEREAQPSAPQHHPEQSIRGTSFTSGEIRSVVAASENIRLWCSLAVAVFIILSHMQAPILGYYSSLGSVFGLPPVYLMLLTNISIVIAKFIFGARDVKGLRAGQGGSSSLSNGSSPVDQLGKAVEVMMLIQHIAVVVFMDFFIYVSVLICGLSLFR